MIHPTRSLLAGLALVSVVGLSACGDTTDDTASTSSTAAAGAGVSGEAVDCSATTGEAITVDIGDFVFEPETVQVKACDQIVWSNTHTQAHTSTGSGAEKWSTGNIQPGDDADPIGFDTPGSFAYVCALHPFMKGTVEVS